MYKIFQRWERVKEVFISRRLNKWERIFGFVRFFEVENVGCLEKEHEAICKHYEILEICAQTH